MLTMRISSFSLVTQLSLLFTTATAVEQLGCDTNALPLPQYPGVEVLDLQANEVHNTSFEGPWNAIFNVPGYEGKPIDFCNVTITYTHPNVGDRINVYLWLPLENWNGRFMGLGGGGWNGGIDGTLATAVEGGYAGANTDAGHPIQQDVLGHADNWAVHADSWALSSPGNVDWPLLQDFASTALDDMTALSKQVVRSFYGKPPVYSYWNGCSGGGRQGLVQAQQYPGNYDGILAGAPAVNWPTIILVMFWGQFQMGKEDYYPPPCEMDAIHQAAVKACDQLDGVEDGIISATGLCTWDAKSAVGRNCCGGQRNVSHAAARIANAMYKGMDKADLAASVGTTHDSAFSTDTPELRSVGGLAQTVCDDHDEDCKPSVFSITDDWIRLFLEKDPDFDVLSIQSEEELYELLRLSRNHYDSLLGTNDANLTDFRNAGGKMIMWNGLADQILSPNNTQNYYRSVLEHDPEAADYYRYFEAPGVGHCMGGPGAYPYGVFQALVDWVEKDQQPGHLMATTADYEVDSVDEDSKAKGFERKICAWPKVAQYVGGDARKATAYRCAEGFGSHNDVKAYRGDL